MIKDEVSRRAQLILRMIVREYIRGGEPVGSRTLSRLSHLNLSPATMRNTMADLEHMGFLSSPHTSAGRIPSAKGFRFFVDNLLTMRPLDASAVRRLNGDLRGDSANDVMSAAANTVSEMTKFAGFVAAPARGTPHIARLRFVKLSSERVLTVIITTDGEIINRVFECRRPASERELNAAAKFFNQHCRNMTFHEAKQRLRVDVKNLRAEISILFADMLKTLDQKQPEEDGGTLQLAGELNLLNQSDISADIRQLRKLYGLFHRKKEFLDIIDRGSRGGDVRVFIGHECGHDALSDCSVVLSPFVGIDDGGDNAVVGYLGVIGPKRMQYPQVISTVEMAAKTVARVLQRIRPDADIKGAA